MKIKGKVTLYWHEDSISNDLMLKVKFKLPDQRFNRVLKKVIATPWWIGKEGKYKDRDHFWKDCLEKTSDKIFLEGVARDLIIKYIKEKYEETDEDKNMRKIMEMIDETNNGFEIEVEYKTE